VNLSSKIKVTLPCGTIVDLKNTVTYKGVDYIGRAIGERLIIGITHLYLRYATIFVDADDPETNFGDKKDLKAITRNDFNVLNGSAGLGVLPLTAGAKLSKQNSNYESNVITYSKDFSQTDLTNFKPADSSQTNYSSIYYMGLGIREPGAPAEEDTIFSIMRLKDGKNFGIPSSGQVTVDYKLILDF
tara:strand:- start:13104 stop:13664 length:561 start_codon:yes stop_codon:yes gene_type:complete